MDTPPAPTKTLKKIKPKFKIKSITQPKQINTKSSETETKTEPKQNTKSQFISKISPPNVTYSNEENGLMTFTVENINVSIINAVRRTILSDIPVFVLDTLSKQSINIIKNNSLFNNEILKQRLGCIPVHITDMDMPIESIQLQVHKKNETNSFQYITTKDFQLYDKNTEKYFPETEVRKIFPKNPITQDYILFARLKPSISKEIKGEEIKLNCSLKKSNAKENSMFNVVSTCAYKNTVDRAAQADAWQEIEEAYKNNDDLNDDEIEFEKQNWFLGKGLKYFKPNTFDFVLESIGIYTNIQIIHSASDILINSLNDIKNQTTSNNTMFDIIPFPVAMKNSFDIKLHNQDYTIGKVIEYILHDEFYREQEIFKYVGFIKRHPHDTYVIIRVAFSDKHAEMLSNEEKLIEILQSSCQIGISLFQKFKEFF